MPKIRDLGIDAIPETMRPPEIGPGGGCHTCTYSPADCRHTYVCDGYSGQAHGGNYPNMMLGPEYQCNCPRCHKPCGRTTRVPYTPDDCPPCNYCQQACPSTTEAPPASPYCQEHGADAGPHYRGGLTRGSIAEIKEQLQRKIDALDEYARNLGPKTAEEIDAREKELKAELEELAARRKDVDKKK